MPIATPNLAANPVQLEQYTPPSILRQQSGLIIPFYNENDEGTLLPGEPLIFCNRVCLVHKHPILPGKWGSVIVDWIASFLLPADWASSIIQGQLVYWDTDEDVVTLINNNISQTGSSTPVAGIGAATDTLPTNGFILGRAVGNKMYNNTEDGNGDLPVAGASDSRVMVVSLPGAATWYGTSGGSSS